MMPAFQLNYIIIIPVARLVLMFPFDLCATGPAANAPKLEPGTGDAPPAGEEEEKKKQKRGNVFRLIIV